MPHFNLRYFLETLGKTEQSIFICQIGAMDGKTFDPLHEYITRYHWGGLMVEPIKDQYDKLLLTYKNNPAISCANVAIAEKTGRASLNRVSSALIAKENTPKWAVGTSSFYTDRNALTFDEVKDHIVQEEVMASTMADLLKEYNISQIDILQIDTEGYDYHVLKQFNFEKYHPLVIHMEIVNLPKEEQRASKRLLDENGYIHAKAGYDLLAVSPRFFKQFV